MALYHFNVNQVSRGKGQTAVASAAYRSGEKLHDSYYDEDPDYRKKSGVLYTDILLPPNAPERFKNRQTLWNEVEAFEKHPKAQLAYSFNIALQNELSMEENRDLAIRFVKENFVEKGMIADIAIHDPDKGKEGIQNPHFHVLIPIRPLNPDGTFGAKQRREYALDESGNRIKSKDGSCVFNAVSTTDWGSPETLLTWRRNWAWLVNDTFRKKGMNICIDYRSNSERGLDLLPTIHEGPTVRAMEARGIKTDKGELNRFIKNTNALIQKLKEKIKELNQWVIKVSEAKIDSAAEKAAYRKENETLIDVLNNYYQKRSDNAYSNKGRTANLKQYADVINFLSKNNIHTFPELEEKISAMYSDVRSIQKKIKAIEAERAAIRESLDMFEKYSENRPIYEGLKAIKRKSTAEKYKDAHHAELSIFYMARRKLKEQFPDGSVPVNRMNRRLNELQEMHIQLYQQYSSLKADTNRIYSMKKAIESDYKKAIELTPTTTKRKELEI